MRELLKLATEKYYVSQKKFCMKLKKLDEMEDEKLKKLDEMEDEKLNIQKQFDKEVSDF